MTSDDNSDLQEKIKSIVDGKNMHKYKPQMYFSISSSIAKENVVAKANGQNVILLDLLHT